MARRLTLRARLALLTAVAVALAVAVCAMASWFLTRHQLYRQLDHSLEAGTPGRPPKPVGREQDGRPHGPIDAALHDCSPAPRAGSNEENGAFRFILQAVKADGQRCTVRDSAAIEQTPADVKVAATERGQVFRDGTTTDGQAIRVYTWPDPDHDYVAISVATPLEQTQDTLNNLALLLVVVSALGIVGAATVGLVIARAALRPVDELTGVVEHIARTEDLDTRIPDEGADDIARLSRSFNTMTAALAGSRDRQQQLIADAGHELRTPLTSLRTNVDLLMRSEATGRQLPAETRRRLLLSVRAQMRELSSLVGDLLELARPAEEKPAEQTVALHDVVTRAVARARLRGPGLRVDTLAVEPWFVQGDPGSLERAVVNLLDNAVKFSPAEGVVQVRLAEGELTVRDHGPGIDEEDRPHVFDRFWRSPSARSLPGSGLGLSIVARVVKESGGEVRLDQADGGGTIARVRFPGTPADPPQ